MAGGTGSRKLPFCTKPISVELQRQRFGPLTHPMTYRLSVPYLSSGTQGASHIIVISWSEFFGNSLLCDSSSSAL